MNRRPTCQARPRACPLGAGLLACSIALLAGGPRGPIDGPAGDHPRVRHLDFSLGDLGRDGLRDLAGATDLRGLDLFATRVADDDLAHLRDLAGLNALYLESTAIGDDGLAHLRGLTRLRTLTLSGTRVTDAGLVHLEHLTGLRALDLSYTAVTDGGIAGLARALPDAEITNERGAASGRPLLPGIPSP